MFCLRNQDITDAKAFFYLFFMSNSGFFNLIGSNQANKAPSYRSTGLFYNSIILWFNRHIWT